jgi:hypothetical protein
MKKLIIVLVIFAAALPLSAQNISKEHDSDMYYVNVSVERVFPSKLGYIVQYRKGTNGVGTIGLPIAWFEAAAGKAELINLPRGLSWPTLTLFYKDGNFSHLRLYVHRAKGHSTWGNIPQNADVSVYFKDQETMKLEF